MTAETKQVLDQKVGEGRFRGRSDANEYYVKRGVETEDKEREFLKSIERELLLMCASKKSTVLLQEFLKMIEEDPEVVKRMREALQQQEEGR
jgi:ApbE superfamily uncharacterized protein (UPF0280 family)